MRANAIQDDQVSGTIFHVGFDGSAFMFRSLRITSWPTFVAACLITAAICLSERYLTYLMSTKWTPFGKKSPVAVSLFRSAMYWIVTMERLMYMLIAMSFHAGLILVVVTSLTFGQFFVELQEAKSTSGSDESYHPLRDSVDMDEPYTDPPTSLFPFTPNTTSRQQPEPAQHQLRVPATASTSQPPQSSLLTPGYRPSPRRVVAFEMSSQPSDIGSGNGRDRAREIMGRAK